MMDLILITLLFQRKKKKKKNPDVFKGLQGLFQILACYKDEVEKDNVEGMLREKRESKAFSDFSNCLYISNTSNTLLFLEVIFPEAWKKHIPHPFP